MRAFTVAGRGSFPISMLRFDECWPADDTDAQRIEASFTDEGHRWQITLRTDKKMAPTLGRWDSFNVRIVDGD